MWRFFKSITRGTRNVRPSQCCTQDNLDETHNNVHRFPEPPSPLRYQNFAQSHTPIKDGQDYIWEGHCCLIKVSKCLQKILAKSKSGSKDSTVSSHKLNWVWAIPCDIYPHLEARNEWDRNKWERFYRRRQQFLLNNSILNALGWGSAAAFTLSLCQYLRTYSLLYNRKSQQNEISSCDNRTSTRESSSNCNQDKEERSLEELFYIDLLNSDINKYQRNNEWQESTISSSHPYSWIVSSVYETIIPADTLANFRFQTYGFVRPSQSAINAAEAREKVNGRTIEEEVVQAISSNEINSAWKNCNDSPPQIEDDHEFLQINAVKTDDSGFIESSTHDEKFLQHTKYEFSANTELEDEESSGEQDSETSSVADEVYSNCQRFAEISSVSEGHHLLFDTSQSTETLESSPQPQEVVLEDSSNNEKLDKASSVPRETGKTQSSTSAPKQTATNFGMDEFSDGLKEIIESGKKDLNDFSTAFLGILEGDIGQSVANEEPAAAIPYFQAGALLGDAASSFNLGLCYHMARGVEQDLKKARELYEAAHLAGHGWATYNLAVMLSQGEGGPADLERAEKLIHEAAKFGVEEAQLALLEMQEGNSHCGENAFQSLQQDTSSTSVQSEPLLSTAQTLQQDTPPASVRSEPLLSVLSHVWSSSYSTSDLDYMYVKDSSHEEVDDLCHLSTEFTGKPTFYLESP